MHLALWPGSRWCPAAARPEAAPAPLLGNHRGKGPEKVPPVEGSPAPSLTFHHERPSGARGARCSGHLPKVER